MRRPPIAPRKHWSRIATVSDETYHDALRRFGEKGLVDLVILAGCHELVCGVLTLFAVLVPRSPGSTEEN